LSYLLNTEISGQLRWRR